ncbi:MAG: YbaK/EbsC family protein [Rhodospirillales bacterium]
MASRDSESVTRVKTALKAAGLDDRVVDVDAKAVSAADRAKALEVEPGAIVEAALYAVGKRMVLVLAAGDHKVVEANLPAAFSLEGAVRKPAAAEVKGVTGFAVRSMPPVGQPHPLPTVIDRSLKRFERLYASAGEPGRAFKTTMGDLKRLTGGIVSWNVARPREGEASVPPLRRLKTFSGERTLPEG